MLRGVSFDVPEGRRWPSSARRAPGKSSVVSLVSRFYDVTGGRVLVDGRDVRDYDAALAARAHRASCSRTSSCSRAPLLENVRLCDPSHLPRAGRGRAARRPRRRAPLAAARGPRRGDPRARAEPLARRAPARRVRARARARPGGPRPRRGDRVRRHRDRGAHPGGDRDAAQGPHDDRRRAPPLDDPRRRPDPRAAPRRGARARHPRVAAARRTGSTAGSTSSRPAAAAGGDLPDEGPAPDGRRTTPAPAVGRPADARNRPPDAWRCASVVLVLVQAVSYPPTPSSTPSRPSSRTACGATPRAARRPESTARVLLALGPDEAVADGRGRAPDRARPVHGDPLRDKPPTEGPRRAARRGRGPARAAPGAHPRRAARRARTCSAARGRATAARRCAASQARTGLGAEEVDWFLGALHAALVADAEEHDADTAPGAERPGARDPTSAGARRRRASSLPELELDGDGLAEFDLDGLLVELARRGRRAQPVGAGLEPDDARLGRAGRD